MTLSAEEGVLSANGAAVTGSNSKNLSITGTLAQVNAALATLHETDDVAAPGGIFELISVTAKDGFGNQSTGFINATAYSLTPVLTVPADETVFVGLPKAIPGVSVSEANYLPTETFSETVSDENGLLSATGAGVAGSDSKNLSIVGTLADVKAALATLTDTDNVPGFDTIGIVATDGLGNMATDLVNLDALPRLRSLDAAAQVTTSNGDNTISSSMDGESVTLGNGNNMITLSGARAAVTAGNGDNTVAATGGGAKHHAWDRDEQCHIGWHR